MGKLDNYIQRGKAKHGERFSTASLAPQFIDAYNSGARVSVAFVSNDGSVYEVRRGTIGITTGWIPCFLLMGRVTDHGSSYTLSSKDKIVSMDVWREFKRSHGLINTV